MVTLSNRNRKEKLYKVSKSIFDLVVIGGGITGAGIALDASSRGLSVLLVEKNDFASGTSSKSTRLIHGGLRYLKNLKFKQVRETALERSTLYKNVPHLIHPENILIPVYSDKSFGKISLSIGLFLYEFLGSVQDSDKRRSLSKKEVIKLIPSIEKEKLQGGLLYKEYRTNDARLVIETIKEAHKRGCSAFNYLVCDNISKEDGLFKLTYTDKLTGEKIHSSSHSVINAAGPWVDDVRFMDSVHSKPKLILSKGVHLVFSRKDIPLETALYFEAQDKRMIFIIPDNEFTYAGTTDDFYFNGKDNPGITQDEASYLIECINFIMPSLDLNLSKIRSFWAGLRPLIHEKGKSPGEISRKDEIFISDSKMITIAGGKLTGFRQMAKRAVDLLYKEKIISNSWTPSETQSLQYDTSVLVDTAFSELKARYPKVSESLIEKLLTRYGRDAEKILINREHHDESSMLKSEIEYCINNEMVTMPSDFLVRRTSMIYFSNSIKQLREKQELVRKVIKEVLMLEDVVEEHDFQRLNEFLNSIENLTRK